MGKDSKETKKCIFKSGLSLFDHIFKKENVTEMKFERAIRIYAPGYRFYNTP